MSTARHSVKAYRTQRARFADPARVTVGRAGAAFLAIEQGRPVVDRAPKKGPQVGDTITALAMNGHRFAYVVTGFHEDGRPETRQWDAQHADTCPCWTSEDADTLPDW
jgi:hypothetical protein